MSVINNFGSLATNQFFVQNTILALFCVASTILILVFLKSKECRYRNCRGRKNGVWKGVSWLHLVEVR